MNDVERVVRKAVHATSRLHALVGTAMLYWWELTHLYAYLFPAR
jgi:hypothetical protein